MKKVMLFLALVLWFPIAAWAAEAVGATGEVISPALIGMVMAIIIPLLIAFGKAKLGMEKVSRLLPVISALLAVVIDLLQSLITNVSLGPQVAVIVGLAGVGIREALDQIKKGLVSG